MGTGKEKNSLINIKKYILDTAKQSILYTDHAVKKMHIEARMIMISEVEDVIQNGEIIENYPEDKRGHSCLLCHLVNDRYIHVVCAPKNGYLAVITAYIPSSEKWDASFKKRI